MSDTPFELLGIDHVVLRTESVDRLVEFYEGLGCSIVRRVESMDMTQLRAGRSMIDVVGVEGMAGNEGGRNLDHFALRIEPFDQALIEEFCAQNNIEAQVMPGRLLGADGYGPAVYIRDPDGNRVELKGPPDDSEAGSGNID